MKLAVDFGTSYSAAAFVRGGEVELISFGGSNQFRTSVFFPAELPRVSDFVITPEIEMEITETVRVAKGEQSREQSRLERVRREEGARSSGMVPELKVRSDAEIYKSAIDLARRNWLAQQTKSAMSRASALQHALYGEEAIEAYLQGKTGHLVNSPKSMLGFSLIGNSRSTLTGITSRIFHHIKQTAQTQAGCSFDGLLLGRPVQFKGSLGTKSTEQALDIISDAATTAGFSSVDFLEEPAAAAWHAHRSSPTVERKTLIVDVGGGTTDLAFGVVGGVSRRPDIRQAWGMAKGGTDIDREFSMRSFMPAFGKTPDRHVNDLFYQAASVHDLVRQKQFMACAVNDFPEPYAGRLRRLQEPGATVRLNRAVERTKIFLSEKDEASIRLGYFEQGLIVKTKRAELEASCDRFLENLARIVGQALEESGPIEMVYLTGGMSRAPYVVATVQRAIGDAELVFGDASYAVISGLAHAAAE